MTDPKTLQPGNGYRLPAAAYHEQQWLDAEFKQLFAANWNLVCTTADVSEPGAFVTDTIGHYPVVVVRGNDGELRGFHNICRHRGARLLDDSGTCRKITCPYHRWQYGLTGQLENVPQGDTQIPLLDKDDWGLLPVATDTWMGLVFVNPDGKAGSLASWLDQVPDYIGGYRLDELTELACKEYVFEANWKFYIENHIDWYHLWYTHARTLSMLDHHAGYFHQLGKHWVSFEPYKDAEKRQEPFTAINWLDEQSRLNGAHLLFPNLALFSGSSWFGTGLLKPLAPDRTRMVFRLWALPGQDPEPFLAGFRQVTQVEDAEMAARLQSTVRSPAFAVGPLTARYEEPLTAFTTVI